MSDIDPSHHYILTLQRQGGGDTATAEGRLTPSTVGGTRQEVYMKLVEHLRQASGWPTDAIVFTLFFSLERNSLGRLKRLLSLFDRK